MPNAKQTTPKERMLMLTRMVSNLRTLLPAVYVAVLLVFAPAILPAAGGPSSEAAFFELYAKVIREVNAGKLDQSIGKKARSLNSELQKKIIAADTRIEALKAGAMKLKGTERDALLDELIAAGAEKERMYLDYRQRLEQLAGPVRQDTAAAASAPAVKTAASESGKVGSQEEDLQDARGKNLTIKSIPEDVTTGEFD
jgi:hypothetical protein